MQRLHSRRQRLSRLLQLKEQQSAARLAVELEQLRASARVINVLQQVVDEQSSQFALSADSAAVPVDAKRLQMQRQFLYSVHAALQSSRQQQQQQAQLCQQQQRQHGMFNRYRKRLAEQAREA